MTTATDTTTTRPYAFHANCDHESTKKARRQCRTHTRRQLRDEKIIDLRTYAATVELDHRSKARKDDLVYRLSFAPAIRETFAIYA